MRRLHLIVTAILGSLVFAPGAAAVDTETVDFIADFEGYYAKPYNDPAGYATVGYGHLIGQRPVRKADRNLVWVKNQKKKGRLNKVEAKRLLRKDLRKFQKMIYDGIGQTPVNQPMMTALTSYIFNLGEGKFLRYRSPYLKRTTNVKGKLKRRDYIGAARDMRIYDAIIENGVRKPLEGLTRRRNEEFKLMKQGIRQLGMEPEPGSSGGVSPG